MAFDSTILHWPTIADFTAHLQTVPRPKWVKGLTNHNTYKPNDRTWAGMRSMEAMRLHYIGKGWSAGPHLYLAAEAPRIADRGIWQLTPISHPGIHAGPCNDTRLGIESVGDFNAAPPSAAQYTLLLAINRAILAHWQMVPDQVNVHNECMSGRTCPGKFLTGAQIRADLNRNWPPPDPFEAWGPIGRPEGIARGFAVPKAWLVNKRLGRCVVPETYARSGTHSVTEFERGMIIYLKARNVALVEPFVI